MNAFTMKPPSVLTAKSRSLASPGVPLVQLSCGSQDAYRYGISFGCIGGITGSLGPVPGSLFPVAQYHVTKVGRGDDALDRALCKSSMTNRPIAVVVGVGPGLGAAVARRFARGGYAVALVARSLEHLDPVHKEISDGGGSVLSVIPDVTVPDLVDEAFDRVRATLGAPEVLVYNAGAFQIAGALEISAAQFEAAWRVNCFGGFLCAQQVLPAMLERGAGTLLFTGATASRRGGARFASLAVGKFGLRALAQSLAREFGPAGIHVAHVVIDGQIDTPAVRAIFPNRETHTFLAPDALAETYWQLHVQDRTAWTLELDVRPAVEKF